MKSKKTGMKKGGNINEGIGIVEEGRGMMTIISKLIGFTERQMSNLPYQLLPVVFFLKSSKILQDVHVFADEFQKHSLFASSIQSFQMSEMKIVNLVYSLHSYRFV